MAMTVGIGIQQFFSVDYADKGDIFEGLRIWEHKEYRQKISENTDLLLKEKMY